MKHFQNILKQTILLVAIGLFSGVSAFSSEGIPTPNTDSNIDSVVNFQNTKSVLFEAFSENDTVESFIESDFKPGLSGALTIASFHVSKATSEASLLQVYLQHKNKLLQAQLFPFHFFW